MKAIYLSSHDLMCDPTNGDHITQGGNIGIAILDETSGPSSPITVYDSGQCQKLQRKYKEPCSEQLWYNRLIWKISLHLSARDWFMPCRIKVYMSSTMF